MAGCWIASELDLRLKQGRLNWLSGQIAALSDWIQGGACLKKMTRTLYLYLFVSEIFATQKLRTILECFFYWKCNSIFFVLFMNVFSVLCGSLIFDLHLRWLETEHWKPKSPFLWPAAVWITRVRVVRVHVRRGAVRTCRADTLIFQVRWGGGHPEGQHAAQPHQTLKSSKRDSSRKTPQGTISFLANFQIVQFLVSSVHPFSFANQCSCFGRPLEVWKRLEQNPSSWKIRRTRNRNWFKFRSHWLEFAPIWVEPHNASFNPSSNNNSDQFVIKNTAAPGKPSRAHKLEPNDWKTVIFFKVTQLFPRKELERKIHSQAGNWTYRMTGSLLNDARGKNGKLLVSTQRVGTLKATKPILISETWDTIVILCTKYTQAAIMDQTSWDRSVGG